MTSKRHLVILVEDIPREATQYTQAFTELGYEVRLSASGEEALSAIRSLSEAERERAILVSDYGLGGMSGGMLMEQVRNEFNLPRMLWSAGASPEKIGRLRTYGKPHHACAKTVLEDKLRAAFAATLENFAAEQQAAAQPGGRGPLDHAERPPGELGR